MLDRQAIVVSLAPAVVFLIIAIVARILEIELAEAVFQFGALAAVLGGGTLAWNKVYSKKTVDRISGERYADGQQLGMREGEQAGRAEGQRIGQAEGARIQREYTEKIEAEQAEAWQEEEFLSAPEGWQSVEEGGY